MFARRSPRLADKDRFTITGEIRSQVPDLEHLHKTVLARARVRHGQRASHEQPFPAKRHPFQVPVARRCLVDAVGGIANRFPISRGQPDGKPDSGSRA